MERAMTKGPIVYYVPGGGLGGGGVHQYAASKLHQNFIPQSNYIWKLSPLPKPGAVCGRAPLAEKFKI